MAQGSLYNVYNVFDIEASKMKWHFKVTEGH